MSKWLVVVFVLSQLFFTNAYSSESKVDYYKSKIRPFVVKVVGEEWATKILGPKLKVIDLPPIPELNNDAKTFNESVKEDKNLGSLKPEDKRKYDYAYIQELYEATRNKKANDNDLAKWMNVLEQGGTREGVYRALVLDNSYAALEGMGSPINDSIIDFTMTYMGTYIRQQVQKETLEKINFYSLKRIVVEKSLDVMDLLAGREDDLQKWYAVFSSELAKKYPGLWKGKIRKQTEKETHYEWARKVPRQHIKGEVILKLHKVYNYLM